MKLIIIFAGCLCCFIACKKPKIKAVNTNDSRDSLTYQPKVPGSRWTYTRSVLGQNTTYNFVRLTYDTISNGATFPVFQNDIDANQYIRQDGDKYYSVLTASTQKPTLLVLDAAKNVNESWIGGVNGSDTYTYTMKEKIPIYFLDGFTFKNVLKVYTERTTGSPNNITLAGDTYYAQGIGQVKTDGFVKSNGITVNVLVKLISVDLK